MDGLLSNWCLDVLGSEFHALYFASSCEVLRFTGQRVKYNVLKVILDRKQVIWIFASAMEIHRVQNNMCPLQETSREEGLIFE